MVNETLSGPLRDIFDCKQLITDVSGCGNNWYIADPLSIVETSLTMAMCSDAPCLMLFLLSNARQIYYQEQIPASQWAN